MSHLRRADITGFAVDFSAYLAVHNTQTIVCRDFISGIVQQSFTTSGSENPTRIQGSQTPCSQQPFVFHVNDW